MTFPIDSDEARAFHRRMIREARERAFLDLDAEAWRILEQATPALAATAAKKAILRDAPEDPRIDAATTVAELRAVWPSELGAFVPPPAEVDPLAGE